MERKTTKRVDEFDPEKVKEYLHLESIPAFTMTKGQKRYLQEYREALIAENGADGLSPDTMAEAFRGMGPISGAEGSDLVSQLEQRRVALEFDSGNHTTAGFVQPASDFDSEGALIQAVKEAEADIESEIESEGETKTTKKKTTRKKSTKNTKKTTDSE